MSEPPRRNKAEEEAIRNYAYRLWELAGCPDGQEQEFWLNAEAELEAKEQISRRPIPSPFVIVYTASNPAPTWLPTNIVCPVPGLTADTHFSEVESKHCERPFARPTLNPGLIAQA
jgi:hypothetical protein